MMDFEENKPFIIGAVAIIGIGAVLMIMGKSKSPAADLQGNGLGEPVFKNDTIFIPTNQYEVDVTYGDKTITNTDNRQSNNATDGGTINNPQVPVITKPPEQKPTIPATTKLTLTKRTSTFKTASITGTPVSVLPPQTVEVLASSGEMKQVKTTLGNLWVKPNYEKPSIKTITHTIKKGETLWGLAQKYTGNGQNYRQIAQLNGITDPNKIFYGKQLKIQIGG